MSGLSGSFGGATIEVSIPNDPALVGSSFHAQWVIPVPPEDPNRLAATRALEITLQNPASSSSAVLPDRLRKAR